LADVNEKYDLSKDRWLIGYYARDTVLAGKPDAQEAALQLRA
jgi:hypothetical protein